jgi:choloylglycine hydrolase
LRRAREQSGALPRDEGAFTREIDVTISRKISFAISALGIACAFAATSAADACTSFVLSAKDGARVYGRTMEFSLPLHSQLLVIPRAYSFTGAGPDGAAGAGLPWTGKYGAAGANGLGLPVLVDGMNEKGLAGGLLFFPALAKFQDVKPSEAKNSIASYELLTWILTNFATMDEVKDALPKIKVSNAPQAVFKTAVPVHVTLHDMQGKNLVIEYADGRLNMYDNPPGVMTNAPGLPWQLEHVGLYGNLSPVDPAPRKLGSLSFAPPSSGGGLAGMPGDFMSPSRFVRAMVYSGVVPALPDAGAARDAARHILNNFDIPPGAIATSASEAAGGGVAGYETTEWTAVADMKNGLYIIWDYANPVPRQLDFSKLDFGAKKLRFIPIDQKPAFIDLSK